MNSAQQSTGKRAFYVRNTGDADPVMQVVELLKLNQQGVSSPVDPAVILHNAERVKLSVLAMLGKLEEAQEGGVTTVRWISPTALVTWPPISAPVRPQGAGLSCGGSAPTVLENVQIDSGDAGYRPGKAAGERAAFTPQREVRIHWQVVDEATLGPKLVISVRTMARDRSAAPGRSLTGIRSFSDNDGRLAVGSACTSRGSCWPAGR